MSLKTAIKNNVENNGAGEHKYYVLESVKAGKDLKVVVVNGVKRLVIDPDSGLVDDYSVVIPALLHSGETAQFAYSKAVSDFHKMLESDVFAWHKVFSVLEAAGTKLGKPASDELQGLSRINMCKYAEMPHSVISELIGKLNFIFTDGLISVVPRV